jgi:hypothetical protein
VDILVTIPKSEAANTVKEDQFINNCVRDGEQGVVQFWAIKRKPKTLNIGDRVYFVENGRVTCYHLFAGYVSDPVCEVTKRVWHGLNLILKCPEVLVKSYIPYRGFQGFRYINTRWD